MSKEIKVRGVDGMWSRAGTLEDGVFHMPINPRRDYFRIKDGVPDAGGEPKKLGLDDEIYQQLKAGGCKEIHRVDGTLMKCLWVITFKEFSARMSLYETTRFRPHQFVWLDYWTRKEIPASEQSRKCDELMRTVKLEIGNPRHIWLRDQAKLLGQERGHKTVNKKRVDELEKRIISTIEAMNKS